MLFFFFCPQFGLWCNTLWLQLEKWLKFQEITQHVFISVFVQGCFSKTRCPPLPGSIFPAAADWPFTLPVPWGTWRWPRREGRRQSSLYVCGALNILHYTKRCQFEFQADSCLSRIIYLILHSPSNLIPTYHYQISLAVLTQNTFTLVFTSQALLACSQIIIYLLQCIWGAAKGRW